MPELSERDRKALFVRPKTVLDYYTDRIQPLGSIVYDMHIHGMRVDPHRVEALRDGCHDTIAKLETKIKDEIGWIPNTRSYLQMGKLFGELKVKYKPTKTGRPATKDVHLLAYAQENIKRPKVQQVILDCLGITRQRTWLSNFLSPPLDVESFYHPMLIPNATDTGRCAGKGAVEGGPQPQNWPKTIRTIVLPDDPQNDEFTQADLKQAEAMTTAWDAGDLLMISAFEQRKDAHEVAACKLFRDWKSDTLPPDEMLKSIIRVCDECKALAIRNNLDIRECQHAERYYSKQIGHATRYKMGPRKLVKEVLPKAGIFITEGEGKRYQARICGRYIQAWWQTTMQQLKKSAILYNVTGRYREFYGQLDDDMLRAALAWKSSSPISDIVNRAMVWLHERLKQIGARIITQTHDSLLINHHVNKRSLVGEMLNEAFYNVLRYAERYLTIPSDLTHGGSWGELH